MSRKVKVACAQTGPVDSEDMASMVPKACQMLEQAAAKGVNIVTFCELFLSPFFPNRLEESFDRFFTRVDSKEMMRIRDTAKKLGVAMILPFGERANTGMYNAALVTNAAGQVLGTYRKTHIPAYFPSQKAGGTGSYEKFYFTPGGDLPVFDVDGVKVGIQICNDRLYPEGSRVLALRGAEVIFMPIAYSVYSDPEHRNSIWELALRSRAFENGVYVVAANRVGQEGVRRHLGRSMVVDPRGMKIAEASSEVEELLVQEIDLDAVEALRKKFPWWRDRRPELYGPISAMSD
jgi:predicted amidohydrolase